MMSSFANRNNEETTTNIPFVSPDGGQTRYYADRFYLDAPTGLLEYQLAQKDAKSCSSAAPQTKYCNGCGERISKTLADAPPQILFNRAEFINSLDLSAAIIGTYSVPDFDFLSDEFPKLFPRKTDSDGCKNKKKRKRSIRNDNKIDHVPTLVLHGQRGFNLNRWAKGRQWWGGRSSTRHHGSKDSSSHHKEHKHNIDDDRKMEQESQDSFPTDILDDLRFPGRGRRLNESDNDERIDDDDDTSPLNHIESKTIANFSDDDSNSSKAMDIRGGGDSQQYIDSQDVVKYQTPPVMDDNGKETAKEDEAKVEHQKKEKTRAEISKRGWHCNDDKVVIRPCFTYDQKFKFKLPRTPNTAKRRSKRIRRESKKKAKRLQLLQQLEGVATSTVVDNCRNNATEEDIMSAVSDNNKGVVGNTAFKDNEVIVIDSSDSSPSQSNAVNLKPKAKRTCANRKRTSFDHTVFAASNMEWDDKIKPVPSFDGDVFFTHINPAWKAPLLPKEMEKSRREAAANAAWNGEEYHRDEDERAEDATTLRGTHHPKFFLLFEKSGSLVVIISTSNLTPVTSTEGSWVQRFHPRAEDDRVMDNIDMGMPSDFGTVLVDFLEKQTEAAAMANAKTRSYRARAITGENSSGAYVTITKLLDDDNNCAGENSEASIDWRQPEAKFSGRNADEVNAFLHGDEKTAIFNHFTDIKQATNWAKKHFSSKYVGSVLPDSFLRRFVPGLKRMGLAGLVDQYQFDNAQAHLVSTVPGDYSQSRRMTYGPQRVASILSRIHNVNDKPWLPPSLMTANDRLVIQPTSFGVNWSSQDLETVSRSYLHPHHDQLDTPLENVDIVWPSLELFDEIERQRRIIWNRPQIEGKSLADRWAKKNNENGMVFMSSTTFSRLEHSVVSRFVQFEQTPNQMPYKSACPHFKSVGRLLRLNNIAAGVAGGGGGKEYLSWFLLTSACFSKGAQGEPTRMLPWAQIAGALPPPRNEREALEKMNYKNFELGVMFSSKVTCGSQDRLYVSDPNHVCGCQCGSNGKQKQANGNALLSRRRIKRDTRKVRLPVPYELRARSYQENPMSNMMTCTPYMHTIGRYTGNMMLTPLGQQVDPNR